MKKSSWIFVVVIIKFNRGHRFKCILSGNASELFEFSRATLATSKHPNPQHKIFSWMGP